MMAPIWDGFIQARAEPFKDISLLGTCGRAQATFDGDVGDAAVGDGQGAAVPAAAVGVLTGRKSNNEAAHGEGRGHVA